MAQTPTQPVPSEQKTTPNNQLLFAAQTGNVDQVQKALKDGADINAKDADGNNVLNHLAAWYSKQPSKPVPSVNGPRVIKDQSPPDDPARDSCNAILQLMEEKKFDFNSDASQIATVSLFNNPDVHKSSIGWALARKQTLPSSQVQQSISNDSEPKAQPSEAERENFFQENTKAYYKKFTEEHEEAIQKQNQLGAVPESPERELAADRTRSAPSIGGTMEEIEKVLAQEGKSKTDKAAASRLAAYFKAELDKVERDQDGNIVKGPRPVEGIQRDAAGNVTKPGIYEVDKDNKYKIDLTEADKKGLDGPMFVPRLDKDGKQLFDDNGNPVQDILIFKGGKLVGCHVFDPESGCSIHKDTLNAARKAELEPNKAYATVIEDPAVGNNMSRSMDGHRASTSPEQKAFYDKTMGDFREKAYGELPKKYVELERDQDGSGYAVRVPENFTGTVFLPGKKPDGSLDMERTSGALVYENGKLENGHISDMSAHPLSRAALAELEEKQQKRVVAIPIEATPTPDLIKVKAVEGKEAAESIEASLGTLRDSTKGPEHAIERGKIGEVLKEPKESVELAPAEGEAGKFKPQIQDKFTGVVVVPELDSDGKAIAGGKESFLVYKDGKIVDGELVNGHSLDKDTQEAVRAAVEAKEQSKGKEIASELGVRASGDINRADEMLRERESTVAKVAGAAVGASGVDTSPDPAEARPQIEGGAAVPDPSISLPSRTDPLTASVSVEAPSATTMSVSSPTPPIGSGSGLPGSSAIDPASPTTASSSLAAAVASAASPAAPADPSGLDLSAPARAASIDMAGVGSDALREATVIGPDGTKVVDPITLRQEEEAQKIDNLINKEMEARAYGDTGVVNGGSAYVNDGIQAGEVKQEIASALRHSDQTDAEILAAVAAREASAASTVQQEGPPKGANPLFDPNARDDDGLTVGDKGKGYMGVKPDEEHGPPKGKDDYLEVGSATDTVAKGVGDGKDVPGEEAHLAVAGGGATQNVLASDTSQVVAGAASVATDAQYKDQAPEGPTRKRRDAMVPSESQVAGAVENFNRMSSVAGDMPPPPKRTDGTEFPPAVVAQAQQVAAAALAPDPNNLPAVKNTNVLNQAASVATEAAQVLLNDGMKKPPQNVAKPQSSETGLKL